MKYDNDVLADICSKFDLLGYISEQHEVKRVGNNFFCHCPLHTDNTASLSIDPEKNRFHCFGCGVGGSCIDYLTKVEHRKFNDAVETIANMTGSELKNLKTCEALAFFKTVKRLKERQNVVEIEREILPSDYMDNFSDELPQEWVDEGMSPAILKEFGVRIDKAGNRIVYPVYDKNCQLIGVKGRTRFVQYKEMGISKYKNYKKISTIDYFAGYKENKDVIQLEKSIVIFEGIKSGMKYSTFGCGKNWLAAETSYLNDAQIRILIELGLKEVTIAFDSDVCFDKIKKCTEKLKLFMDVYYIKNFDGLLGDKEAPVDRGVEVWNRLFERRIKI